MFCQFYYYRHGTTQSQTVVAPADDKYQCEEMSDCPYTGTTLINKIPWGDCPVGEEQSNREVDSEVDRSGCYDVRNICNIL